jgi:multiple sugar transport system ATP-binding protein
MASLEIAGVKKRYGNVEVLKGIDIGLETGEFLVLLGPSGCGKSTLLNIIAGLTQPSEGEIKIDGRTINNVHPKDRDIAMVFQSYALYPNMTVANNLGFGLEMRGVGRAQRQIATQRVAALLQIEHLLDRKPSQLSGGQRQRVAIGRALVREPKVFLFDEPLSNLDAKLRVEMRTEIKKLHQRLGTTIVYVTHDQIEAMTLASRIAIMRDGLVQQFDAPQTIYEQPANMYVAGFVGSPAMNFVRGRIGVQDGELGIYASARMEGGTTDAFLRLPDHPDGLANRVEQDVVLGIRPETITRFSDQDSLDPRLATFEAEVEVLEPTGADTLAVLSLGERGVTARIRPSDAEPVGNTMRLSVDMSRASLFDPETELRL